MRRRDFLALGASSLLAGCKLPLTLEQGLMNECRVSMARMLRTGAIGPLVEQA